MPLELSFSDDRVLSDPLSVLQEASVKIAAHRSNAGERARGKKVATGGYRGTVLSVGRDNITLQTDDGAKKSLALTSARARQLTAGDTTRK